MSITKFELMNAMNVIRGSQPVGMKTISNDKIVIKFSNGATLTFEAWAHYADDSGLNLEVFDPNAKSADSEWVE